MNNKVTCEKFDVLLYATFGRPLDVQISPLSTRLQWTEKGRPMDVQYGTWTDGPNKDVLWTSLGRTMPIGFDSLFSFKKLTQMRIKISRISYFSFSFKLNNKKKVSLKMLALRGVYKKNVCWRGVVALKKIMNKVMCTSGRPPSLLN